MQEDIRVMRASLTVKNFVRKDKHKLFVAGGNHSWEVYKLLREDYPKRSDLKQVRMTLWWWPDESE